MGRVNIETFHLIYSAVLEPIFFKIINTAEQQTLWLKKNSLELLHPRGEKCGKVVLQLSLAEGISQGYQIVQSWCPYH